MTHDSLVHSGGAAAWRFAFAAMAGPRLRPPRRWIPMLIAGLGLLAVVAMLAATIPASAGPQAASAASPAAPAAAAPAAVAAQAPLDTFIPIECQITSYRINGKFEDTWKTHVSSVYTVSPPGRPPGPFRPTYFENPKQGDLNFQTTTPPAGQDFNCSGYRPITQAR